MTQGKATTDKIEPSELPEVQALMKKLRADSLSADPLDYRPSSADVDDEDTDEGAMRPDEENRRESHGVVPVIKSRSDTLKQEAKVELSASVRRQQHLSEPDPALDREQLLLVAEKNEKATRATRIGDKKARSQPTLILERRKPKQTRTKSASGRVLLAVVAVAVTATTAIVMGKFLGRDADADANARVDGMSSASQPSATAQTPTQPKPPEGGQEAPEAPSGQTAAPAPVPAPAAAPPPAPTEGTTPGPRPTPKSSAGIKNPFGGTAPKPRPELTEHLPGANQPWD